MPLLRPAALLAVLGVGAGSATRLVERRLAAARLMADMAWVSAPEAHEVREALPDSIRARVASSLLAQVGTEYSARLRYAGGSRERGVELSSTAPAAGSLVIMGAWVPFRYRLRFALDEPALGGVSYVAEVVVHPNGDIIGDVAFPPVRAQRALARIVPLGVAFDTAAARGIRAPWASLEYSQQDRAFRYVLSSGTEAEYRSVMIDAHTGRVVRFAEGSPFICLYPATTAQRPEA